MGKNGPVFVTRHGSKDGLDFFPTPPWATRAICELHPFEGKIWEPASGLGHMSDTLKEYNKDVHATDIIHGHDFLVDKPISDVDWIVTNPPFNKAEEFVLKSFEVANRGIAMLVRINFTSSQSRYNNLYSKNPPAKVYQFVQRVIFNPDRVARHGASAVDYIWIIWDKQHKGVTEFHWIPPCKKRLEKDEDYDS